MSWFRRPRSSAHPAAEAPLFAIGLNVKAGTEPLPDSAAGAYVTVFCSAPDATTAAWTCIQAVEAMGYSVPDNPQKADMMQAGDWEAFVNGQWPELVSQLPTQSEVYERLAEHRVIFGPFAAYEG